MVVGKGKGTKARAYLSRKEPGSATGLQSGEGSGRAAVTGHIRGVGEENDRSIKLKFF